MTTMDLLNECFEDSAQWFRQLFCLHAWWCGDLDYSRCLKCEKWRDVAEANERGKALYWRVRDLERKTGLREGREPK